jgi:hypothetical protein
MIFKSKDDLQNGFKIIIKIKLSKLNIVDVEIGYQFRAIIDFS